MDLVDVFRRCADDVDEVMIVDPEDFEIPHFNPRIPIPSCVKILVDRLNENRVFLRFDRHGNLNGVPGFGSIVSSIISRTQSLFY